MKVLFLVSCLICFAWQSRGQYDPSRIDKKDLKRIIKILTSDSLEGRGTGTEGQWRAANFISGTLKERGLHAVDENGYLQKFKLNQTYWGQVYIKTQRGILTNFANMLFQGNDIQNEEVEKELVFGGSGTEEELNQVEVKDRFVFVFVKNLRSTYDINKRLLQRKACGVVMANLENEKQFQLLKNTMSDHLRQKRFSFPVADSMRTAVARWDTIRFINSIAIPHSEIINVCGLSARALTKLMDEKRVKDVPIVKIKVRFERITREIETANVLGVVKGKSNKTIVVSAHYDHLGKSGETYFPGADDNASGTAALLEMAEAFSKAKDLPYTMVFLATSGEEAGLLGSSYYVNHPRFDARNILCNLNIDMISRNDDKHSSPKYLYCLGTAQSAEMDSLLKEADQRFEKCSFDYSLDSPKNPTGLFSRSDNYHFYKKGVVAILFFSGLHKDYHQVTDTADKIDFGNLENRVRQISLVLELLQQEGLRKGKAK